MKNIYRYYHYNYLMYKIYIPNSNYTEWYFYDENNMLLVEDKNIPINPLEKKLFNNDVIDSNLNLVFSQIRTDKYIAGILIYTGKTYGRHSNQKLNYKCVPNDPKVPAFIIPYEEKTTSFEKNKYNKFILFKFKNWSNKHPFGELITVLGNINDLSAYYEYQLYCKNLCISIKEFTNEVNRKMRNKDQKNFINTIISNNGNIQKREDCFIFTIDSKLSTDLDDAIGIKDNILSVYIANVPLLIEFYELWNSFSERISTIYLPDRKRPMLPTLLSENLCSLLENEDRFVFCMDIVLNENKDEIIDITFNNALIKINKNFRYNDTKEYEENINYKNVFNTCVKLCKKYKYIKDIKDSHDLIAFLMILMNFESAKKMINYSDGIYRTLKMKECDKLNTKDIPSEVFNFIKIWQSSSGHYTNYENRDTHDMMAPSIEEYLHITSPIRRLVDLLNMMKLQTLLGLNKISEDGEKFYQSWIARLEYINTTMRCIRKIQIDCNTLSMCINEPNILNTPYEGFIFDKIEWGNQYLQYTIYIPKIKIITRINTKLDLPEYSKNYFKLYIIEDGVTLKKKIRAELYT